jgi:Tfp pilus assembly pilus retraction ATPase PilT
MPSVGGGPRVAPDRREPMAPPSQPRRPEPIETRDLSARDEPAAAAADFEDDYSDVTSIADLPFTDIFLPLIVPLGAPMERARYSPEITRPGQAKTRPFPLSLESSIDELRQTILAQREAKPGEFEEGGLRHQRWWNGAITYDTMRLRYAVSLNAFLETWCVIRRVPLEIPPIEGLGIHPEASTILKRLGMVASGLILVVGATSAGKTTTAVSMLGHFLRQYGKKAYTIEDPCEYRLQGLHGEGLCLQTEAEYNGGFAHSIKTALRSYPDYILIGEIRDSAVALAALQAAMSGHLVIATLHAGSVADALDAFVRLANGASSESIREQIAQQLVAIIHQVRNQGQVSMNILDASPSSPEKEIKKDLRRLLSENRTGALGEKSWTRSFAAPARY